LRINVTLCDKSAELPTSLTGKSWHDKFDDVTLSLDDEVFDFGRI